MRQWYIYTSLEDQRRLTFNTDFTYNKATVKHPGASLLGQRESLYEWFSFDKYESQQRNFDTFKPTDDPEFLAIYLGVAGIKREISVAYKTWEEFISDVSGNWAVCLFIGVGFHHLLRQLRCASHIRDLLLSRGWTMQDWYMQYQTNEEGVCNNCGKRKRDHDQGIYCDDAEDARTIYIMSSDDPTTASRRMSTAEVDGLCRICGKQEAEHFLVDDVLYCDEPVVSNDSKVTLGRRATIYDMPMELHQLEKKSEEEHCQIQKLTAIVKALEKHCGLDADGPGPTNLTQQTATSQEATDFAPSSPSLPRPAPAVSALQDDEGSDGVVSKGPCAVCGRPVLSNQLRYVHHGRYIHQVFIYPPSPPHSLHCSFHLFTPFPSPSLAINTIYDVYVCSSRSLLELLAPDCAHPSLLRVVLNL